MSSRLATKTPERPAAESNIAEPVHGEAGMSALIDAIVEQAPQFVRRRVILPSVDWRQASPVQIARLWERLKDAGIPLPSWLVRDLLIGGHPPPAGAAANLPADATALAALVERGDEMPLPEPLRQSLLDCASGPPMEAAVAKAIVARLVSRGEEALAVRIALAQWPQTTDAWRVLGAKASRHVDTLPAVRLRIASFSSTQVFADALRPAFATRGRRAVVYPAPYGSVISELLQPSGEAEALFLLIDLDGWFTADWRGGTTAVCESFERRLEDLCAAVTHHSAMSETPVLLNTLPVAAYPAVGHVDLVHEAGAAAMIRHANVRLAELAASAPGVQLIDTEVALADIAPRHRTEPKLWYFGRMAYSEDATRHLARAFATAWSARTSGRVKVVALDFDNTLWGGVYGDDGIEGLACGDDVPGNAFKALQSEMLRLKSQGFLLIGLSKNNPDAITVFERHAGMVLRAGDFAATAVDWEPKPDNIRRLAADLNLGLDSFLFLDDSPHERAAMRRMCPEVVVPELPEDPARRPAWVRSLACTWPLRVTGEDARRSDMYVADLEAKALRASAVSYEDYLAGLQQRLAIAPLERSTLTRVAQLHERTNQFNLTTRRFTEAELLSFMTDVGGHLVITGAVADRFGDHGLVIAGVVRFEGRTARIESFIMSCRVMARSIETAFLGALLARLRERGIERVEAAYLPTAKNLMVRDFYRSNGFESAGAVNDGELWFWRHDRNEMPTTQDVAVQWSDR